MFLKLILHIYKVFVVLTQAYFDYHQNTGENIVFKVHIFGHYFFQYQMVILKGGCKPFFK